LRRKRRASIAESARKNTRQTARGVSFLPPRTAREKTLRRTIAKGFSGATRSDVMAELIKPDQLKIRLKKIPEWELEKKHIERSFEFDDFTEAVDFVNAVAEVSEDEEHHPDIDIRYNKVRLILTTHSKGGLTDLDFALAERIDTLSDE
jgi:4a-hydroxytetrahydrobiopterin dehydratase